MGSRFGWKDKNPFVVLYAFWKVLVFCLMMGLVAEFSAGNEKVSRAKRRGQSNGLCHDAYLHHKRSFQSRVP
jgi:hypothetical protein